MSGKFLTSKIKYKSNYKYTPVIHSPIPCQNPKEFTFKDSLKNLFMPGSCHLDRAWNVKIGVECQIFIIVIFFNSGRVLQFGAHSRYYKGALTLRGHFFVVCTTFRSDFHVGGKIQTNIQR